MKDLFSMLSGLFFLEVSTRGARWKSSGCNSAFNFPSVQDGNQISPYILSLPGAISCLSLYY